MSLTEFLFARIAEEEAIARKASGGTVVGERGNWQPAPGGDEWELLATDEDDEWLVALRTDLPRPPDVMSGMWGAVMTREAVDLAEPEAGRATDQIAHAVLHDPARVLTECEVKRWMVKMFGVTDYSRYNDPEIMKQLARPYAGHPDFQPKWAL